MPNTANTVESEVKVEDLPALRGAQLVMAASAAATAMVGTCATRRVVA